MRRPARAFRGTPAAGRPLVIKWIGRDGGQRARIEAGLGARGRAHVIVMYKSAQDFLSELGRHKIDILVVSARSVGAAKLEETVLKATRRYPFDILYYGAAAGRPANAGTYYSTVRVVGTSRFSDVLLSMIDESPSKWESPRFIRGMILSRAVDLEGAIDDYLLDRLARGKKQIDEKTRRDCYKLLYDYSLSLRPKSRMLEVAMTMDGNHDKDLFKLIESISNLRNRMAHSWMGVDEEGVVVGSKKKNAKEVAHRFGKAELWKTLQDADRAIRLVRGAAR